MSTLKILLAAAAAMSLLTIAAAACGDGSSGDDVQDGSVSARLENIEKSLEREQVIGAVNALNQAGIHKLDSDLQQASSLDPAILSTVRRARYVVSATTWPEELMEKGAALVQAFKDFEMALESEDLQASKAASITAHSAWHTLDQLAYSYLAGEEVTTGAHH